MGSLSGRLLVLWLLCALIATLAPFNFDATRAAQERSFTGFTHGSGEQDLLHLALNLVLFVPLGALLHHPMRRSRQLMSIVVVAGTAAFLISFGIESLQRFLADREPSLADLTMNMAGGVLGVFGGHAWGSSIATWLDHLRASMPAALLAGMLVGLLALTLLISAALQTRSRLSNWSPDYPLLIGNEDTGDRPWRGQVFALEITDAATPVAVVERFAAGNSVRPSGSAVAAFDFTGSPPYHDAAGHLPDLNRVSTNKEFGRRWTDESTGPWLRTDDTVAYLADRLRSTSAFTLRIRCATKDLNQVGPARIVSNSGNPSFRNFMIGQRGSDLVIRLRTPVTGLNGAPPETIVPDVFVSNEPHDILVTYDGSSLVAAVASVHQIVRTDLTPGFVAAVALGGSNVRFRWWSLYQVGYLASLYLPAGVLIALFGRSLRCRLLVGAIYVVTSAIAVELTLVMVSGHAFEFMSLMINMGVATAVLAIVCAIVAPGHLEDAPQGSLVLDGGRS